VIEVENLTKLYGDFAAVTDLSFTVKPGEVMGLVGPNGAGKTTTLRCLSGIIPPSRGSLRLAGHDLRAEPTLAKQHLAWFSDEPKLFDYLTVWEHLAFTARIYHVHDWESRGHTLLADLEMTENSVKLPGELSRGMKQKLALACGLLHSPRAVLFDEPLTGLDPLGIRKMKHGIKRLAADGAAIVMSSHLLHLVEEVCSHILIVKGGRKVIHGTLDDITRTFAAAPDASLEQVFLEATSDQPRPAPAPPPPLPSGDARGP
jgi:ABC-2 type transport system ATP-binding protein